MLPSNYLVFVKFHHDMMIAHHNTLVSTRHEICFHGKLPGEHRYLWEVCTLVEWKTYIKYYCVSHRKFETFRQKRHMKIYLAHSIFAHRQISILFGTLAQSSG
jgi:hypothetical protein